MEPTDCEKHDFFNRDPRIPSFHGTDGSTGVQHQHQQYIGASNQFIYEQRGRISPRRLRQTPDDLPNSTTDVQADFEFYHRPVAHRPPECIVGENQFVFEPRYWSSLFQENQAQASFREALGPHEDPDDEDDDADDDDDNNNCNRCYFQMVGPVENQHGIQRQGNPGTTRCHKQEVSNNCTGMPLGYTVPSLVDSRGRKQHQEAVVPTLAPSRNEIDAMQSTLATVNQFMGYSNGTKASSITQPEDEKSR